jgi:epsin
MPQPQQQWAQPTGMTGMSFAEPITANNQNFGANPYQQQGFAGYGQNIQAQMTGMPNLQAQMTGISPSPSPFSTGSAVSSPFQSQSAGASNPFGQMGGNQSSSSMFNTPTQAFTPQVSDFL